MVINDESYDSNVICVHSVENTCVHSESVTMILLYTNNEVNLVNCTYLHSEEAQVLSEANKVMQV